mmetsp:Transcript_8535/g.23470  ORF Transcript_8535/g.23470 Transcript_8535/m.23470 type:complete len:112 (+) Transcript_8535:45-380(+)
MRVLANTIRHTNSSSLNRQAVTLVAAACTQRHDPRSTGGPPQSRAIRHLTHRGCCSLHCLLGRGLVVFTIIRRTTAVTVATATTAISIIHIALSSRVREQTTGTLLLQHGK